MEVNAIVERLELVRGGLEYLLKLADDLPENALGEDGDPARVVNAHGQAAAALIYLDAAQKMLSGAE